MLRNKNFIACILLSHSLGGEQVNARPTCNDVLAIAQNPLYQLEQDYSYLSPILGMIGLESGLIFNYRFYGPYTAHFEENGERRQRVFYKDGTHDKISDPLWRLIKELFPSSQGTSLSSIVVDDPKNLGRYICDNTSNGALVIALFLTWAQDQRQRNVLLPIIQETSMKKENGPLNILATWLQIKDSGKENEFLSALGQLIDGQLITHGDKQAPEGEKLKDIFNKTRENPEELTQFLEKLIQDNDSRQEKEKYKLLSKSTDFNDWCSISQAPQPVKALPLHQKRDKIADVIIKNIINETNPDLLRSIKRILCFIEGAIQGELKEIYPAHTTEQVLLAYFDEMYNTEADVQGLMEAIKNYIPTAFISQGQRHSRGILSFQGFDYGALYKITSEKKHSKFTPYLVEDRLLQNMGAQVYDRHKDELLNLTFADCVEAALMHVMNLTVYDPTTLSFNLEPIESDERMDVSIKENLLAFYDSFAPEESNNGSIKHRSLWSKVVGDLNRRQSQEMKLPLIEYSDTPVDISEKIYNTYPGFINFTNILLTITNTSPTPIDSENIYQKDLNEKNAWITTNLENIFQKIGVPDYEYLIKITSFNEGDRGDLFGQIHVVVTRQELPLFSYTINAHSFHSWVDQVKEVTSKRDDLINQKTKTLFYQENLDNTHAFTPLLLDSNLNNLDPLPWHSLFTHNFSDDESRSRVLTTLAHQYKQTNSLTPLEKSAIDHILLRTSWQDKDSASRIIKAFLHGFVDHGDWLGKVWNTLNLSSLNLRNSRLAPRIGKAIAQVLETNQTLTCLDLADNDLEYQGSKALAESLKKNKTLTSLDIGFNYLGHAGEIVLAEVLNINQTLLSLNLTNTGIMEGKALTEALEKNQTLTSLRLGYNRLESLVKNQIIQLLERNKELAGKLSL